MSTRFNTVQHGSTRFNTVHPGRAPLPGPPRFTTVVFDMSKTTGKTPGSSRSIRHHPGPSRWHYGSTTGSPVGLMHCSSQAAFIQGVSTNPAVVGAISASHRVGWKTDEHNLIVICTDQPAAPQTLLKLVSCGCAT